ncbi:MAG: hypothetical protein ACI4J6_07120 [Oscillospiraceae bacterium]
MSRTSCKGCIHYRTFDGHTKNGKRNCHYILDTGEPRGYPASSCTKKEPHRWRTVQAQNNITQPYYKA